MRRVSFSSDSASASVAFDPVRTGERNWNRKWNYQPIKKFITRPFQTYSKKKMTALEEKLAEAVRQFPVLYDKSCRDLKDSSKKKARMGGCR